MSIELQTALIAGIVALVTASVTGILSWQQIKRERARWLFDLKTSISLELYKARMVEYSVLMKLLAKLSRRGQSPFTPSASYELAQEINNWMYNAGGLYSSARTRNAVFAIRDVLLEWKDGNLPKEIIQIRDALIWSMKKDLDIPSDKNSRLSSNTILKQLQDEMQALEGSK